jgi:filamentous hemagglutinin
MNDQIAEYLTRIASIRQQLGVSRFKNIAIADWEIGNKQGTIVAISGQATRKGTVSLPNSPIFQTFEVPPGHSRAYDSEYKILEELAFRYAQTRGITGRVILFTERPPCASCSFVIEQFRQRFAKITLIVNHAENPPSNL